MVKGTLRGMGRAVAIEWGPPDWSFSSRGGERLAKGVFITDLVGLRCKNCKTIIIPANKESTQKLLHSQEKHPQKPQMQEEKDEYLYTRLLGSVYGTLRKDTLDMDIENLIKKGLSRIDAIKQLAIEKLE
jgi:hypothetical protein